MSQSTKAGVPALNLLRNCALLLCLFAPSMWMIATIPPLWRDVDAYNQLAQDPLVATFWGQGTAYSYVAKVPLFFGEKWEQWRGIAPVSLEKRSPQLTDTGVWLLIIAQHIGLGGAAFWFICSVSQFSWIRLALALGWASNALFYTFAHCTGAETLSLILVVLIVAKGLRLIRSHNEPAWMDWYIFAILLCLCLLTRHLNVLLILFLPAALLFSWAQNRVLRVTAPGEEKLRWRRQLGSRQLRQAAIAMAIGVACVAVVNSLTHYLARKTKLHPHSRIGYTFVWRLHFLTTLSPPSRTALLQKIMGRTHAKDVRQLLALLAQMHEEGADVNTRAFTHRAIPLLFPGETVVPWEKLDLALNKMAFAFLLPPTREHLQAARGDFVVALNMSVTEIPAQLFTTTTYFFDHPDEMPACATLVTFRNASREAIKQIPSRHAYFRLWQGLNYKKAFLIWFASLGGMVLVAHRKQAHIGARSAFGMALVAVGLLTVASSCLLTDFLPRYALPMWLLLLLSLSIFIGAAADLIATGKEKSAGQLPRLG